MGLPSCVMNKKQIIKQEWKIYVSIILFGLKYAVECRIQIAMIVLGQRSGHANINH